MHAPTLGAPPPPPPAPPAAWAPAAPGRPASTLVLPATAAEPLAPSMPIPVVGSVLPQFSPPPDPSTPGHRPGTVAAVHLRPMLSWRLLAAGSIAILFALSALQVQRVIDGETRSTSTMYASIAAGVVAAVALLVWTYSATDNARRLVAPALTSEPPDPKRAMLTWAPMMVFLAGAALVVAELSSALNTPDENPSSVPLAIAVLSVLLAVPLAYWPLQYLSRVVRQVGGHSADLGRWMWVPVVLAVVGVATVAGLHAGGAVDNDDQLAPMWVVAVVAIAPCLIVLLLGWRAGESVEEAISLASARRAGSIAPGHGRARMVSASGKRRRVGPSVDVRAEVRQVPGSDSLRFAIVVSLAGLALLSIVGAAVMLLFWMETRDAVVLASQRDRAWETIGTLHDAARGVGVITVALVTIWTFVAVLNVRMATGLRRNPLLAAAAWPTACVGVWILADRLTKDSSVAGIVGTLVAQAAVLYVPFFLLERTADSAGARRTPLRMSYVYAVVLLVYAQGLVTLSDSTETVTNFELGRLAGYLGLGAVVLLLSTLAVTEACRSIATAAQYEAQHHNALVEQRRVVEQRAAHQASVSTS
ncbi:MAG: hypothetical protein ABWZ99_18645 [Ilumatobacteraceae bacterium]